MTAPAASRTVKVLPGSQVPRRVGVESPVIELSTGAVIPGADGAVVSTVNVVAIGDPVFPARSVRVTL